MYNIEDFDNEMTDEYVPKQFNEKHFGTTGVVERDMYVVNLNTPRIIAVSAVLIVVVSAAFFFGLFVGGKSFPESPSTKGTALINNHSPVNGGNTKPYEREARYQSEEEPPSDTQTPREAHSSTEVPATKKVFHLDEEDAVTKAPVPVTPTYRERKKNTTAKNDLDTRFERDVRRVDALAKKTTTPSPVASTRTTPPSREKRAEKKDVTPTRTPAVSKNATEEKAARAKTKVEAESTPKAASRDEGAGGITFYYIQIAVSWDRVLCEKERDGLKKTLSTSKVFVKEGEIEGNRVFKLKMGRYASRDAAERALAGVKRIAKYKDSYIYTDTQ